MARKAKEDKVYFANLPDWSEEFAAACIDRFEAEQKRLESSKRHSRIQRSWRMAFSRDQAGNADMTEIGSAGRKGEVLLLQPNRYGRIIRNHVTLVTQTKTNPDPAASNSDPKSQDMVALARGVCDHYRREFDLEGVKAERAMVAEICGDSYLHVPWDPQAGREIGVRDVAPTPTDDSEEELAEPSDNADEEAVEDSQTEQRIYYEGDFRFSVLTAYNVAYDHTSPDRKKPRWWIIEDSVNRWDFLAQVQEETSDPELKEKLEHAIKNARAWTDRLKKLDYDSEPYEYDDSIPVYYVYVEKSKARPEGRCAIVIDKKTVFIDGPMIDPRAPVFRLAQGNVLFRNEATTPNHDGLPLCEALAGQMSTILSNAANFGLQRILSPRESNIDHVHIDTGAAWVPYNAYDEQGRPLPQPAPWAVNPMPPGLAEFYELLAAELDLIMADSAVTRGDPKATQGDSGSKVAALFAAAQNVASSFVADVLVSEEELYTFLVQSLAIRATSDRVITIVGEDKTFQTKQFKGDAVKGIVRVVVPPSNAMRDTLPGRMALVEAIEGKTPEQQRQIIAVMETGRMEPITDPSEQARLMLERENEWIRTGVGTPHKAIITDQHAEHAKSHMNELNNPDTRNDPQAFERAMGAFKEHAAFLMPNSPVFDGTALTITGQAPLPGAPAPQLPSDAPGPHAKPHDPNDPNSQPAEGKQGGAPNPNGAPKQPDMPKNPIDGQQMAAQGRPAEVPMGPGG